MAGDKAIEDRQTVLLLRREGDGWKHRMSCPGDRRGATVRAGRRRPSKHRLTLTESQISSGAGLTFLQITSEAPTDKVSDHLHPDKISDL